MLYTLLMSTKAKEQGGAVLNDVGQRIREARDRLVLTQEDLSARTGVAVNTISSVESGHNAKPRYSTIRRLADGLGEAPEFLWTGKRPLGEPAGRSAKSSPVEEFASRARELDRAISEERWEEAAEMTKTYQNLYGFADRYVRSLPAGAEKTREQKLLFESNTLNMRSLSALIRAKAAHLRELPETKHTLKRRRGKRVDAAEEAQ
jgi:transcriptional regulator with XRE-family HTH domain